MYEDKTVNMGDDRHLSVGSASVTVQSTSASIDPADQNKFRRD
jgi:hypothetical protein